MMKAYTPAECLTAVRSLLRCVDIQASSVSNMRGKLLVVALG